MINEDVFCIDYKDIKKYNNLRKCENVLVIRRLKFIHF